MTEWAERNAAFVRRVQSHVGAPPDGKAGPVTEARWDEHIGGGTRAYRLPADTPASLEAYYGPPGTGIVLSALPYPMRLAWDLTTVVHRTQVHRRARGAIMSALEGLRSYYGLDGVRERGLDRFGGIYSARPRRTDLSRPSVHWHGAAIDLDPLRNGLRMPWPHAEESRLMAATARWKASVGGPVQYATMPLKAVEIMEAAGLVSLGRLAGSDAMHFQLTR